MGEHSGTPGHVRLPWQQTAGVVALAIAIFMACGRQVPLPVLDHAPASALSLVIAFDDNTKVSDTLVVLTVEFFTGGHEADLSGKQQLTCNGVAFSQPSPYGGRSVKVERQPAGGSYTFAYTDEQEHTTTFSVPAIGRLALTSPAPGAAVPIPRPVAQAPTPSAIEGTRTPDLAHAPLTVHYAVPGLPPYSLATVVMTAWGNGGEVQGRAAEPATGTYSISDASIAYSYGFESFMPGAGDITSLLQVTWWQVTDFQQVKLTYSSYTESPVVWKASAG